MSILPLDNQVIVNNINNLDLQDMYQLGLY